MSRRRIGNTWVEDPPKEVPVEPKKKSKSKVKKDDEEQPSGSD
jgi:hypothetical protein